MAGKARVPRHLRELVARTAGHRCGYYPDRNEEIRPARRRSRLPRLRHGSGQPGSHEEPSESLRKMLAVGREELGTGDVPRREQRLEDRPREREDFMKIDDPMPQLDPSVALGVQEVEVPDVPSQISSQYRRQALAVGFWPLFRWSSSQAAWNSSRP